MKRIILGIITIVSFYLCGFSQTDFICYTGNGKVVLNSGDTITGIVEYCLFAPAKLVVKGQDQDKQVKYKVDEVKEFNIDEKHYFPITFKGGAINIGSDKIFGRLLTSSDSKIEVYLTETQPPVVSDNNYTVSTSYYASVPGESTVYALSDLKFNPCKKLAQYVSDCTALVSKIEGKEKGYFYPMMTTDEVRKDVLLTITREYQDCR